MYQRSQCNAGVSSIPTCANCTHTFRAGSKHDTVVCVPYLKTMPADHSQVCELYSRKQKC